VHLVELETIWGSNCCVGKIKSTRGKQSAVALLNGTMGPQRERSQRGESGLFSSPPQPQPLAPSQWLAGWLAGWLCVACLLLRPCALPPWPPQCAQWWPQQPPFALSLRSTVVRGRPARRGSLSLALARSRTRTHTGAPKHTSTHAQTDGQFAKQRPYAPLRTAVRRGLRLARARARRSTAPPLGTARLYGLSVAKLVEALRWANRFSGATFARWPSSARERKSVGAAVLAFYTLYSGPLDDVWHFRRQSPVGSRLLTACRDVLHTSNYVPLVVSQRRRRRRRCD